MTLRITVLISTHYFTPHLAAHTQRLAADTKMTSVKDARLAVTHKPTLPLAADIKMTNVKDATLGVTLRPAHTRIVRPQNLRSPRLLHGLVSKPSIRPAITMTASASTAGLHPFTSATVDYITIYSWTQLHAVTTGLTPFCPHTDPWTYILNTCL